MNSPYTTQNDINAFRSGLQAEHDSYAAGLASKQNSYLQNLANVKQEWGSKLGEARSHLESAQELLKSGFESEAGIAGGAIAAKAALHLKRVVSGTHDYRGNLTEKGKRVGQTAQEENTTSPGETGKGSTMNEESKVGDTMEGGDVEMSEIPKPPAAASDFTKSLYDPANQLKPGQRIGRGGGIEEAEQTDELFGNTDDADAIRGVSRTRSLWSDRMGETKSDMADFGDSMSTIETKTADLPKSSGGGGAGETKTMDSLDDLGTDAGETASKAAEDLTSNLAKKAAISTAEDVGGGLGDAALDTAAAAFSWVPFVGEVLTGAAAIVGLGTAIAGGIETIQQGAKEAATEKGAASGIAAATAAVPRSAAMNYAGGYVAPAVSSIQT